MKFVFYFYVNNVTFISYFDISTFIQPSPSTPDRQIPKRFLLNANTYIALECTYIENSYNSKELLDSGCYALLTIF